MGDHALVYPGDWRRTRRRRGSRPWPVFLGFLQVIIGTAVGHWQLPPLGYALLLAGPAILLAAYKRFPGWSVAGVSVAALGFYALEHTVGPVAPSIIAAV